MPGYSSTIKTMGFLYLETKKAAALLLKGETGEDIIRQSLKDNIFLMKTEIRKREIASTILKRIDTLDSYLLNKIVNGNLGTSKLIVLLSIMKTDQLFFEFMHEVFAEKLFVLENKLTTRDLNIFFNRKCEQSEQVAHWTDYTHYKLGQVYKKILIESGMAKSETNGLNIIRPVIEKEVIDHIKDIGDQRYLNVMIGRW